MIKIVPGPDETPPTSFMTRANLWPLMFSMVSFASSAMFWLEETERLTLRAAYGQLLPDYVLVIVLGILALATGLTEIILVAARRRDTRTAK